MNIFNAIATAKTRSTIYEQYFRAELFAKAVLAVQWHESMPDEDAADQLLAILRFCKTAMGAELIGFVDGAVFNGIDVRTNTTWAELIADAELFLDLGRAAAVTP